MEKVNSIFDWIKLSPKYMIPISFVSGFLIFADDTLLNKFGLNELVTKFRPYLGLIFLLSIVLIISNFLFWSIPIVNKWINNLKINSRMRSRLNNLTQEEKEIFLGYILENTRSQFFALMDGVVLELKREGLIYGAINASSLKGVPYNINPWVWNYLRKNQDKIFSKEDIKSYKEFDMDPSDKSNKRVNPFYGL